MAVLEIHKDTAPVLKKTAKRIRKVDDDLLKLAADMAETMVTSHGVGLAGNQVGVLKRIITVLFDDGPRVFINPQITAWSGECEMRDEGCLSFPDLYGSVKRDLKVEVQAQDLELSKHMFTVEGFGARVFQHEIDHLNGITFTKRADPSTLRIVKPEEMEEDDGEDDDEDGGEIAPEDRITIEEVTPE